MYAEFVQREIIEDVKRARRRRKIAFIAFHNKFSSERAASLVT